jgi:hypothetical protein
LIAWTKRHEASFTCFVTFPSGSVIVVVPATGVSYANVVVKFLAFF